MKEMGAFRKPVIVTMDWHDIMFYGDAKAEGVKGTSLKTALTGISSQRQPLLWEIKLTVAVTPVNNEKGYT